MSTPLVSLQTARIVRKAIIFNEWSDEARAAALEARRRKAQQKYKALGYKFYSKRQAGKFQPSWVNKWELKNLPKANPKLRAYKQRLEAQYRDFGDRRVEMLERFLTKVGITPIMEKLSGSKRDHASWVDKRTGYRYDFHPVKGGKGVFKETDGRLIETAPNGDKRELRGPKYHLFKKNCQMANKFLPEYIKKFNRLREEERKLGSLAVNRLLMALNGGPGSGHHGHKGIKGHRGGSLPEDGGPPKSGVPASIIRAYQQPAQLSETPQASAKRRKLAFTQASKYAELYGQRADELERKRKAVFRLKVHELEELADVHRKAAENYEASGRQSTMIKGSTIQEQKERLAKAAYHKDLARKYESRLGSSGRAKGFTKKLGDAFIYGLIGGTPEEVAQQIAYKGARAAGDIGVASLRGGFKQAIKEGRREIEEEQDLTMPMSEIQAAEKLIRRAARQTGKHMTYDKHGNMVQRPNDPGPFSAKEKAEWSKEQKQTVKRRPTIGESVRRIGLKSAAEARREYRNQVRGVKDRTLEAKIDAEIARRKEAAKEEYKRAREEALKHGIRASDVKTARASTKKKQVGDIIIGPSGDIVKPDDRDVQERLEKLAEEARRKRVTGNQFTSNFNPITANLSGQVRRETLHGKDFLVAPLSMIVPGVLPGSKGPLLYPEEEVRKNPSAWNNIPIVVNHPMKDGIPVEARSPDILERYQIGTVFNARYKGKLVAEGWFDVERTRKVNTGVYDMLLNGRPIELSTGLYTDNEPFEGVHNGREYKFIARNYRPDHLAILLTSKGACSLKDGCGVLINKCGDKKKKKFQAIRNERISPEIQVVLNGVYGQAAWQAVKDISGVAGRAVGKKVQRVTDKMRGIVPAEIVRAGKPKRSFISKHPKTAMAITGSATGAAGYKAGEFDKSKKRITRNIGFLVSRALGKPKMGESKVKKYGRVAHHGVAGAGTAAAGTMAGAALGTAVAPGIGTIVGGAAGGAMGAWAARRNAQKYGGKAATTAADVGGLVGTIAAPSGVAKAAGSVASKAPFLKRAGSAVKGAFTTKAGAKAAAKGIGRTAADIGTYTGTTAALDKTFGPVRKRRPTMNSEVMAVLPMPRVKTKKAELAKVKKRILLKKPVENAWTDEARQKSAETRRRRKASKGAYRSHVDYRKPAEYEEPRRVGTGAILAGAAVSGAGAGLGVSARKNLFNAGQSAARAVKRSFADPNVGRSINDVYMGAAKRAPGYGRKLIDLLKKIKIRRFR